MDESFEAQRRPIALAHLAMLAALACYGVLLWLLRGRMTPAAGPQGDDLGLPFFAIGVAQYVLATWFLRRRLPGPPDGARSRVRSFFLIRFAAAEAIGIFGLIVGFLGARPVVSGALLGVSVLAMLASAPTRQAWEAATKLAAS